MDRLEPQEFTMPLNCDFSAVTFKPNKLFLKD